MLLSFYTLAILGLSYVSPLPIKICNDSEFEFVRYFRSGEDADVMKVKDGSGKFYIKKTERAGLHLHGDIKTELKALLRVNGMQGFPQLICILSSGDGFVMREILGKTLGEKYPNIFNPRESLFAQFARLAESMSKTIQDLHRKRVVHLDLHPHNWILSPVNQTITVIDFGSSKLLDEPHSPAWSLVPELESDPKGYSEFSDVWYLASSLSLLYKCLEKDVPIHEWQTERGRLFSAKVSKFLSRMSNPEPKSRPTMRQVVDFFSSLHKSINKK